MPDSSHDFTWRISVRHMIGAFALALTTWLPSQGFAQGRAPAEHRFGVGLLYGFDGFSGSSTGTGSTASAEGFKLFGNGVVGLTTHYGNGKLRVGMSFWYATPGVGLENTDFMIVGKDVLEVVSLAPSVTARLARLRGEATLHLTGSVLLERWKPAGTPGRNRVGGLAGLQLEVPLTGRLVAAISGLFGVTPASPFTTDELPAGYQPRALWRRMLLTGLSYHW